MPVATWQWLAAGTVAVAVHAVVGLALVGSPSPGGGAEDGAVSVALRLGAGGSSGEARRLPSTERAAVTAEPVSANRPAARPRETAAPPVQAVPVHESPPPESQRRAPSRVVEPAPAEASAGSDAKPAQTARRIQAATAPPLPQARPHATAPEKPDGKPPERASTAGSRRDEPGDGPSRLAGDLAEANEGGSVADRFGAGKNAGTAGRQDDDARAGYVAALQAWLERHMRYPERAVARRQQGTATLYFVVDRLGRVLDYRLEQSSGHRLLDREALAMIERAAPMPQMPASLIAADMAVVVPISFALR